MPLLAERFRAYAVDLRGQGRSSRTPGRYTLDNMGNDLVRFIDGVIGRSAIVSGLSSGGVLSAWLSAYAKAGQVIGCLYEDPPLFVSEVDPGYGHSIRQGIGPMFALWSKYLGDQWSIGDWEWMVAAAPKELPARLAALVGMMLGPEPTQNLKEYDPEWGRAFWTGSVGASCRHDRMLSSVKVPVLLTHHFWKIEESTAAWPAPCPASRKSECANSLRPRARTSRCRRSQPWATPCTARIRSSSRPRSSSGHRGCSLRRPLRLPDHSRDLLSWSSTDWRQEIRQRSATRGPWRKQSALLVSQTN
jgi:pimeloyl-ACP methyl ester carboxylesterase